MRPNWARKIDLRCIFRGLRLQVDGVVTLYMADYLYCRQKARLGEEVVRQKKCGGVRPLCRDWETARMLCEGGI